MEHHADDIRKLFKPELEPGVEKVEILLAVIKNPKGKTLSGLFIGKSLVIPLSVHEDGASPLGILSADNLKSLDVKRHDIPAVKACGFLGLSFCVNNSGIFAGTKDFGTLTALHLHPELHGITPEDSLNLMKTIFTRNHVTIHLTNSFLLQFPST